MIVFPRIFKPCMQLTVAGQTFRQDPIQGRSLRVAATVRRSMTSTADSAVVKVYNAAPERRTAMSELLAELGRAPLFLATGYDGLLVQAFAGDVRTIRSYPVGGDIVTEITADDAGDAIAETVLSGFSTLGLTARDMINVALAAMAQAPAFATITPHPSVEAVLVSVQPAAVFQTYATVVVGRATDLLDEAARLLGARWWIRDLQLFMAVRGVPTDGEAVRLFRSHWLTEPTDDKGGVVHLSTFADPNLTPGRQVALEGRLASGAAEFLRVEAAATTIDTQATAPWSTALDLRRLP